MGRCDSQNLTPKVGVAYDQVSVFFVAVQIKIIKQQILM